MVDNIKNAVLRTLSHVIGHDASGKGGRQTVTDVVTTALTTGDGQAAASLATGSASTGSYYLRRTRMKLDALLAGVASTNLNISIFGDSWSYATARWTGALTQYLISKYGDAKGGWVGFGYPASGPTAANGHALPDVYPVTITGTWTANYNGATTSPDFCRSQSSTLNSIIETGFPAGLSTARLFYGATSDGSSVGAIAYSFDTGSGYGAETLANLSGLNQGTILLTGMPAIAGKVKIRVNGANTCRLDGIYFGSSNNGVRVNKLAVTGSKATDAAALAGGNWQTSMALLPTDLNIYLFATNDQGSAVTADAFGTALTSLLTRAQGASTRSENLIAMPCENLRTNNSVPMAAYRDAARNVALTKKAMFIDFQPLFGDLPADYADLFAGDLIHPIPETGAKILMSGFRRAVEGVAP